MTLAEKLKAKYYDPDMDTCDVKAIVNAALERAAQELGKPLPSEMLADWPDPRDVQAFLVREVKRMIDAPQAGQKESR